MSERKMSTDARNIIFPMQTVASRKSIPKMNMIEKRMPPITGKPRRPMDREVMKKVDVEKKSAMMRDDAKLLKRLLFFIVSAFPA